MSVRANKRTNLQVIQDRRTKARQKLLELSEEVKSWELAEAALNEKPRTLTYSNFVLHYVPTQVNTMQEGTCTECGEVSGGYKSNWTGCPVCLSKFMKVETEETPHARLTNQAVREARAAMIPRNGELHVRR